MYQIGWRGFTAICCPAADTFGRRFGMWLGCLCIILGTIVQGVATRNAGVRQFMGGRFLLGFGVNIASAAGPMYVVEVSHPAYRGVVTPFSIAFARGADNIGGDESWRLIIWVQFAVSSSSPLTSSLNLPDGFTKQSSEINPKGNPTASGSVTIERIRRNSLEMDGADKRWWDYRALFKNRSTCYRLFCNVSISIFGQWAGNAVLSYFMGKVLQKSALEVTLAKQTSS
ncbi:hypothetical protein DID88_008022 [Monilinia fructigena]|uniref:Major facilitator superfamily (MFS) profile domain-containing protein n=1 Tax=Monilinia fructigena TaxID=38457 RepID=A0A395J4P8_9HELO|nr:hypothetical protein DID88_008022 [Monilinia fructigena]